MHGEQTPGDEEIHCDRNAPDDHQQVHGEQTVPILTEDYNLNVSNATDSGLPQKDHLRSNVDVRHKIRQIINDLQEGEEDLDLSDISADVEFVPDITKLCCVFGCK